MAYSKIILNGETLMDVTSDTVNSDNLLSGETATRNSGAKVTGNLVPVTDVQVDGTSVVSNGIAIVSLSGKADASHTHNAVDITDLPTIPTITLNGSSSTSPSFYAPTSAGTDGYYLKSNGSGAPTWASVPAGVTVTLNGSSTTTPSFYAPTSAGTSGYVLTSSGSGAPTWTSAVLTDENVKSTAVTGATTNWIVGSTTSTTTTGGLSKHASARIYTSENTGTNGFTQLRLGNETAVSSAGGKEGQIRLYGTNATYYLDLKAGAITDSNKTITFPNKTGTVALTSDIPTVPTITLNGSSTTSPSFYAPTSVGTSGQYLKSNGSGAPSWTNFPTIPSITLNGSATTSPSFYAPTGVGTSGYVLQSSGSGAPTWTSAVLTDEKVATAEITSGTMYFPVLGTNTTAAETKYQNSMGFSYTPTLGSNIVSPSTSGTAILQLGTNTDSSANGSMHGVLRLYSHSWAYVDLKANASTLDNRTITLPNKTGTVALTSDVTKVQIVRW